MTSVHPASIAVKHALFSSLSLNGIDEIMIVSIKSYFLSHKGRRPNVRRPNGRAPKGRRPNAGAQTPAPKRRRPNVLLWGGGGGPAPCGRPHRKLKLESTDVILSSSHAKKLASFLPEFRLWTEKTWKFFCDIN